MPTPLAAPEVLDREFLEIRARVLEIAAALDRLARAAGDVAADPRIGQLRRGIESLADSFHVGGSNLGDADRAERIQMIFSLPYQADWKQRFALEGRG